MATCEELAFPANECPDATLTGWVYKLKGKSRNSWHLRFCAVRHNFLYFYTAIKDKKPWRIVCLDDAVVSSAENEYPKRPYAIRLHFPQRKYDLVLSTSNKELMLDWQKALSTSSYPKIAHRAKLLSKYLQQCGELLSSSGFQFSSDAVAGHGSDDAGHSATGNTVPSMTSPVSVGGAHPSKGDSDAEGGDKQPQLHEEEAGGIGAPEERKAEPTTLSPVTPGAAAPVASIFVPVRQGDGLQRLDVFKSISEVVENMQASGATERVDALRARIAEVETERDIAQEEIETLRSEIERLTAETQRLNEQLRSVTESAAGREATQKVETEKTAALREELTRVRGQLAAYEEQKKNHTSAAEASNKKNIDLNRQLAKEKDEVRKLTRSLESIRRERDDAHKKVLDLQKQLDSRPIRTPDSTPGSSPSNRGRMRLQPLVMDETGSVGRPSTTTSIGSADLASVRSFQQVGRASLAAAQAERRARRKGQKPPLADGVPDNASDSGRSRASSTGPWASYLADARRLEAEGRLAEAVQLYQAVVDMRLEEGAEVASVSSGQGAPAASTDGLAAAYRDLGRVLAQQGRYAEAEANYRKVADLFRRAYGRAHSQTACALTDLAAVLREQGKYSGAEECAKAAVEALRRSLGAGDVSTATALYNLAGLHKRQGKLKDAEMAYTEALKTFESVLGDDKGETADTLYQLGCLYRKRSMFTKAARFFSSAANAYAKAYGRSDKRVVEATKRARAMIDRLTGRGPSGPRSKK